jgi:hypothetical protein
MELKKTFIAGKMNKDLDERLIPDGEFIDALNITIDTAGGSNIGSVSNSLGNTLVSDIQTIVENEGITYIGSNPKTIGAVTFEANNLIYWMVVSDTFEAIFEYSEIFSFTSIVLMRTDGLLGFNKNYPITGINYIPETSGEGPFLYWTDGINPPRRINISRAKSYVTDDPRMLEDINVILRPPLYAPKIDLFFLDDADVSNNIQEKFIYFSYRFRYKDNQYSSLAPFSSVSFHANEYSYDYNTGDNKGMLNKYNKVNVTVDTGNEFVEELQILYFDTYKLNVYIVDNYNKKDIPIFDNSKYTITFSANKIYTPLESSEVTRLFDNVPLTAKAQDIIGNRLLYGNYVQFRDIVNYNGIKIIPDYILQIKSEDIKLGGIPSKTFRSDRDYEIGIIYTDEYGRMTTALTSKTNTLYIPATNSDTANSIKLELINEAPFWATNYRFAIKQAQGDYYNIFPREFITDGVFRYFLINESDRDKITVGGYIIFKTASFTATYSNKQFKILELEYKQVASPFTTEGLYFKIKASESDTFLNNQTSYIKQSKGISPPQLIECDLTVNPIKNAFNYVNPVPVYYSVSGDNTLPVPFPAIKALDVSSQTDRRIAIKIVSPTEFQWTSNVNLTGWSASITIPTSTYNLTIGIDNYETIINLKFDSNGTNPYLQYTIGDIFIFNVRGLNTFDTNPQLKMTGTPLDPENRLGIYNDDGTNLLPVDARYNYDDFGDGYAYNGHALLEFNSPILPGAVINIQIITDRNPLFNVNPNTWTAIKYYDNIEEWFWNEGYQTFNQYNGTTLSSAIGAIGVIFRNGIDYGTNGAPSDSNYITQSDTSNSSFFMCIRGFSGLDGAADCSLLSSYGRIIARLEVTQQGYERLSAETVPLNSDVDLFYEMRKTYRIDDNHNHLVGWAYADFTDAGPNFPTIPAAAGQTALGPLNPLVATSTDLMHSFNVGERIYVSSSDTVGPIVGPPSGYYNILYVTEYVIVIDWEFVLGATIPGKVFYQSWEQDQDGATHLIVELNNTTSHNSDFNAFAFGNGVESYRIYDNFLRPTMKYSPRATSVIEDYQQQNKFASLCYSGIYKGDTSANRLNSFNLSQANFKNLDQKYGPVQKLYALDTNLMAFQQDKITSVLYGKNLLVDAVGGGQVASVPEVLGNQIVHPSEYGISNNPESFATFSNIMFFSDSRRGAVLQMTGDQVIEISANGMQNYFRDEMKDSPNTQKLGVFDPYNSTYVLSFTDEKQGSCDLSISPTSREIKKDSDNLFMFSISSNDFWVVSLVDDGFGTDWLSIGIDSGYGSQDITASVDEYLSVGYRSVIFRVTYCDGETVDFILTQNGPV